MWDQSERFLDEIRELRLEHQRLSEYLGRLELLSLGEVTKDLESLLREVLEFVHRHHVREEAVLFPWLGQQAWLSQGGPRCTDFLGRRLVGLSESRRVLSAHSISLEDPPFPLDQASPLRVPLEEHQVGAFLANRLNELLEPGRSPKSGDLLPVLQSWMRLLEEHRSKEDDCLFLLIESQLKK